MLATAEQLRTWTHNCFRSIRENCFLAKLPVAQSKSLAYTHTHIHRSALIVPGKHKGSPKKNFLHCVLADAASTCVTQAHSTHGADDGSR